MYIISTTLLHTLRITHASFLIYIYIYIYIYNVTNNDDNVQQMPGSMTHHHPHQHQHLIAIFLFSMFGLFSVATSRGVPILAGSSPSASASSASASYASGSDPKSANRLIQMCGLGSNGICAVKNVMQVPPVVIEICARCGNYWGNLPGFDYCCRCSDKIFAFCMEAVLGGEQDNGNSAPFRS